MVNIQLTAGVDMKSKKKISENFYFNSEILSKMFMLAMRKYIQNFLQKIEILKCCFHNTGAV
jgi:predicted RNase H-like nuclease